MRKRTVKNLFDNIMWYTIYLLPILVGIISAISLCGGDWYAVWNEVDGDTANSPGMGMFIQGVRCVCEEFQFAPIFSSLVDCFDIIGDTWIPFDLSFLTYYFAYFISVYIAHLFVDFVLFIPRLCHKWMNAFTNAE